MMIARNYMKRYDCIYGIDHIWPDFNNRPFMSIEYYKLMEQNMSTIDTSLRGWNLCNPFSQQMEDHASHVSLQLILNPETPH